MLGLLWHRSNSWFAVVGDVEESHLLGIKQDLFSALVNGASSPQPAFQLEGMDLKQSSKTLGNTLTGFIKFVCLNKQQNPQALSLLRINKEPGFLTLWFQDLMGVFILKYIHRSQILSFCRCPEVSTCIGEFLSSPFHNVSPAGFKAFAVK